MIERKEYLDKLLGYKDKQLIKVITGIRRCGKSTLLEIYRNRLKEQGVSEEQLISINFEDFEYDELRSPKALYSYLTKRLIPDKKNYIFLDEIQNVDSFPRVVDSLFIKDNVDLYITGSNAYMLSSEIATLLSGRYVLIEMMPFSFKEYVASTGSYSDIDQKYIDYLERSSFPYTLNLNNDANQIKEYLNGIYSTVILKDIVARKNIGDVMMLESIVRFLFNNIGNKLSTKKISDTMTSAGRKINVRTVESYISALKEAYVVYEAKRYDIKGKQYLKTLEKYYVVDIGLRYTLLGNRKTDIGHILENVIYLELIRRGYDVFVGKLDDVEVDFVAMNSHGIKYIQVAATVRDEATLVRELRPLQRISDHYGKCILTLDRDPIADYDGIRRMNALDFLLGRVEL